MEITFKNLSSILLTWFENDETCSIKEWVKLDLEEQNSMLYTYYINLRRN